MVDLGQDFGKQELKAKADQTGNPQDQFDYADALADAALSMSDPGQAREARIEAHHYLIKAADQGHETAIHHAITNFNTGVAGTHDGGLLLQDEDKAVEYCRKLLEISDDPFYREEAQNVMRSIQGEGFEDDPDNGYTFSGQ